MAYAHPHHGEILRKSLEQSTEAISDTEEMRDPYMAGHQKRVAKLAVAIASDLGLDDRVIGVLNIGAEKTDAFSEGEVKLLSEAAADLSFGIASQRAQAEQGRIA